MSEARAYILRRIREALRTREIGHSDPETMPMSGVLRPPVEADPAAAFAARLEAMAATWEGVDSFDRVPVAVLAYLERQALPAAVVVTGDPVMRSLEWPTEMAVAQRAALDEDRVSVTSALAGVAETGTLLLASSARTPTTLNFLPEHHIVVLHAAAIVPHLEDLWPIVRALPDGIPRSLNLITGPSRTADVEQTIQLGAHGPRRLHLLLVSSG